MLWPFLNRKNSRGRTGGACRRTTPRPPLGSDESYVYTSKTYSTGLISFVETRLFTRLVQEYLSDDAYRALQKAPLEDPEAGAIVPGSGGVRKPHWGIAGRGKRGGLRVIYFLRARQGQIWMLTMYPKNVADNIPAHVLRQIKDAIDG